MRSPCLLTAERSSKDGNQHPAKCFCLPPFESAINKLLLWYGRNSVTAALLFIAPCSQKLVMHNYDSISSHEETCRCNMSLRHVPATFSRVCKRYDFFLCYTSLLHFPSVCTTQIFVPASCRYDMSLQHEPSCLPTFTAVAAWTRSIPNTFVVLNCVRASLILSWVSCDRKSLPYRRLAIFRTVLLLVENHQSTILICFLFSFISICFIIICMVAW